MKILQFVCNQKEPRNHLQKHFDCKHGANTKRTQCTLPQNKEAIWSFNGAIPHCWGTGCKLHFFSHFFFFFFNLVRSSPGPIYVLQQSTDEPQVKAQWRQQTDTGNKRQNEKEKQTKWQSSPRGCVCSLLFFIWVWEEEAELLFPFYHHLEINKATEAPVLCLTSARWHNATVTLTLIVQFLYSFSF